MSGRKKIHNIISIVLTLIMIFSLSFNVLAEAGNSADELLTIENNPIVPNGSINNAPVQPLKVTTTANLVKKGDYFDVKASFLTTTTTNAVSFVLNYDSGKFEYAGNLGADPSQDSYINGVTCLNSETTAAGVQFTLMIPDYKAVDLVSLRFRVKENADIQNANNSISATADYVYKDGDYKYMMQAFGTTDFTTSGVPGDTDADGRVTMIDLSNVIDMFGVKKEDAVLWAKAEFFDFNKNNAIDIADIVNVAKLIN